MQQTSMKAGNDLADPRPPPFVIRAAEITDLSDFIDLALVAGAGFTSLPANEALLAQRLHHSNTVFNGEHGALFLALEDERTGRVVGCAAIKTGNTPRPDFLNFAVSDDQECLSPSTIYGDFTEVGSLMIHPDYRQFGVGRWLAQSRYLLIADDLDRFGDHVFSELRGIIDEEKNSPFYDGVLADYLNLTYEEADYLSSHGHQAELNAMLPTDPIRLDGVSKAARTAIGCPHQDGQRALQFLEDEGFVFEGAIDLLDGGPLVVAKSRQIRTIRSSFEASIRPGDVHQSEAEAVIMSAGRGKSFRSVRGSAVVRDQSIICSPDVMEHLHVKEGDWARFCPDRRRRTLAPSTHQRAQAELAGVDP